MKEVIVLSSKNYTDQTRNYGDCIIANTGSELIIYDCGSNEHADVVLDYMKSNNFETAKLILSHNDSDHFGGVQKLLDAKKLSVIKTTLLLKYTDIILDKIDDKRKTRESVKKQILELYDNIALLSEQPIEDIYEKNAPVASGISIVGPSFDYMIETVAKRLDGREGNTQDGETAVNATSIQVCIEFDSFKLLLCGDCSFAAIEDKARNYQVLQLPHHGKNKQAQSIFNKKYDQLSHIYLVSDNTGGSNGGSDDLDSQGFIVRNTKNSDHLVITSNSYKTTLPTSGKTFRSL